MSIVKTGVVCATLALTLSIGCGGPAYEYDSVVTGTVTVDGELAKSGTVIFHPVEEKGLVATGQIFPDGSYSLRTGQGDLTNVDGGTVKSGEYVVTVSMASPPVAGAVVAEGGPPVPGPSLISTKYALKDTSDLRRTVAPGPNVFVLALSAAEPISAEGDAAAGEAEEAASLSEATAIETTATETAGETMKATDSSETTEQVDSEIESVANPNPIRPPAEAVDQ